MSLTIINIILGGAVLLVVAYGLLRGNTAVRLLSGLALVLMVLGNLVLTRHLSKEQAITEKLKAIIIPERDVRQANIHDVVAFLQEASRAHNSQRGAGVNMILNLRSWVHRPMDLRRREEA